VGCGRHATAYELAYDASNDDTWYDAWYGHDAWNDARLWDGWLRIHAISRTTTALSDK